MHHKEPEECTEGCTIYASERNRYFTGKYMTARDFQGEQDYFLSHHRWHNRLLHGWGVLCGLEVKPHRNPECRGDWVVVGPGVAIDCCGRELVLERETALRVYGRPETRPPESTCGEHDPKAPDQGEHDQEAPDQEQRPQRPARFLICLEYKEVPIEYVPVLYSEGAPEAGRREANRVRETAELTVCREDDIPPGCWRSPRGDARQCLDDCDEATPGPTGSCLDPDCPCGGLVPLALITPRHVPGGAVIDEAAIDINGRRTLPVPPEYLTHVIKTNWVHGCDLTLDELRDWNGRLEVTFDRAIQQPEPYHEPEEQYGEMPGRCPSGPFYGTGINEYTFQVQYGGVQRDVEIMRFDREHPPALEDGCRAVFTIDPELLGDWRSIVDNVVYVTLKCDFILDCHGNPVDGDHLGGVLPTGNGTKGGVFESWFRVVNPRRGKREGA